MQRCHVSRTVRVCCHCDHRHSPAGILQALRKQPAAGPGAGDGSRCARARAHAPSAGGPPARRACAWQGVVLVEGAAVAGFCAAWAAQPRWAFALDYAELTGAARCADPELRLPPLPGARSNPTLPSQAMTSYDSVKEWKTPAADCRSQVPLKGRTMGAVRANARPILFCGQGFHSLQARRRGSRPARCRPQARQRCPRPARRRPRRAARTARRRPRPPRACTAWPSPGRRTPFSTCARRRSTGRRWRRCWRPARVGLGLGHPTGRPMPSQARAADRPRRSRTAPRTSCACWRARARARPAAGAPGRARRAGRSRGAARRPQALLRPALARRRPCLDASVPASPSALRCGRRAGSWAPCRARRGRAQAARGGGGRRGGGRARGGLALGARRVRRRQRLGQPRAGRQGARAFPARSAARGPPMPRRRTAGVGDV